MLNTSSSRRVTAKGYAKANLYLNILGGEVDNLGDKKHLVDTIYYALDLHDDVTIEYIPGALFSIATECQSAGQYSKMCQNVPLDETNLAVVVTKRLLKLLDITPDFALKVLITKRIPVCAGLAGGSADAAAALVALRELLPEVLGIELQDEQLLEVARTSGSDIPFALMASTLKQADGARRVVARGTHYGEVLEELNDFPEVQLQIFPQEFELRACEVYKKWDELQAGVKKHSDRSTQKHIGFNALQKAVFALSPELITVFRNFSARIGESANSAWLVSGSGPTILHLNMQRLDFC